MKKFLLSHLRDDGPAGTSKHALTIVTAADLPSAQLIGTGLYPNVSLVFEDAGDAPPAEPGQLTSVNALDEQGLNAIGGARDMLEDVAGMEGSPPAVAGRCFRAASEITRLFGLPLGPASERAAARISALQIAESAAAINPAAIANAERIQAERDARDRAEDPDDDTAAAAVHPAVVAAAASVAALGPAAGIQSDAGPLSGGPLPIVATSGPAELPAGAAVGPIVAAGPIAALAA